MLRTAYIEQLKKVESLALGSRLLRLSTNPIRYFHAILFRALIYKRTKREKEVISRTFFQTEMRLLLPSSTDIYLTGGKSHHSEIRLARFLIHRLNLSDTFVDIGAHYGYFTLLASKLVGQNGKIYAFEAAPKTFNILKKNKLIAQNINCYNYIVSEKNAVLTFYEFPNLYSEYNTLDISQFKNEPWFSNYKPKEIKIKSIILEEFFSSKKVHPNIIKIDVEGAEFKVIRGLQSYLSDYNPIIIIEYLSQERGNMEHQKAEKMLKSLGYESYFIDQSGALVQAASVNSYLKNRALESDNIVFLKN